MVAARGSGGVPAAALRFLAASSCLARCESRFSGSWEIGNQALVETAAGVGREKKSNQAFWCRLATATATASTGVVLPGHIYYTDNEECYALYYPESPKDIGVYNVGDGSFKKFQTPHP